MLPLRSYAFLINLYVRFCLTVSFSKNSDVFNASLNRSVKYWICRTMKWFRLGGFIILKSSSNSYHVVFNRKVDCKENVKIVSYVVINTNFNASLNK